MKTPYLRYVALFLLAVGVLLAGMGLWLTYEHHTLLSEGVEVQARVEHKEAKGRPGQQAFSAQLVPADQPSMSIKVRLTEAQFAATAEGESLVLAYLPADPANYVIGGLDQARRLGGPDRDAVIGGVLALVLGAGLLWQTGRRPGSRRTL